MISVKRIRFYTAVKCGYTSVNAGDVANHIANEHDRFPRMKNDDRKG